MHGASVQNAVQAAIYLRIGAWIACNGPRACVGRGRITLGRHHDRHAHRSTSAPFLGRRAMAHWFANFKWLESLSERILSLINETPTIRDSDSVSKPCITAHFITRGRWRMPTLDASNSGCLISIYHWAPCLNNINLTLERGQSLAIVGATGGREQPGQSLAVSGRRVVIALDGVDYREKS